jgi:NADH-quinone oxidoreductase subunit J
MPAVSRLIQFLLVEYLPITLAVVFGLTAVYLLLPRPRAYPPLWGAAAGGAALLAGWFVVRTGALTPETLLFYIFSALAVVSGVLLITQRNPVRAVLAFALVVLSTCGLFLLLAAPFLMAATVIVYAGAIVVTFLFVIMLAQAEGQALYDRMTRAPRLTTLASFLLLATLAYSVALVRGAERPLLKPQEYPSATGEATFAFKPSEIETRLVKASDLAGRAARSGDEPLRQVVRMALAPTASTATAQLGDPARGLPPPHVASLGGSLYTEHLLTVELAGVLLFVALVGAASIAAPRPPQPLLRDTQTAPTPRLYP